MIALKIRPIREIKHLFNCVSIYTRMHSGDAFVCAPFAGDVLTR